MKISISMLFTSKNKFFQSLTLYSSLVLSLIAGIIVSILNTKFLGPEQFGDFKYAQNLFALCLSIITFGVFVTSGNLFAIEDDRKKNQFLGGVSAITFIVSILFLVCVAIVFSLTEKIYTHDLLQYAKYSLILVLALPFQSLLENILRGGNFINLLAILNAAPQVISIFMIFALSILGLYSLTQALFTYLFSVAIVVISLIIFLKPDTSNCWSFVKLIIRSNKQIGFPIYLGVVVTYVTTSFGNVSLGYYMGPIEVGYFSLAWTITAPLTMIPVVISTAYYKEFIGAKSLSHRLTLTVILVSLLSLLCYLRIIDGVFMWAYGEQFAKVLDIVGLIALAATLHGIADFWSRFLLANNMSRALFLNSSICGVVNVAGYFILVSFMGLSGAVYTRLVVSTLYLALTIFSYFKHLHWASHRELSSRTVKMGEEERNKISSEKLP